MVVIWAVPSFLFLLTTLLVIITGIYIYICVCVCVYRPIGRPHLTWMDTAMHDMGSLGRTLQIDLPRDWASLALHRDVWRGVVSRC